MFISPRVFENVYVTTCPTTLNPDRQQIAFMSAVSIQTQLPTSYYVTISPLGEAGRSSGCGCHAGPAKFFSDK